MADPTQHDEDVPEDALAKDHCESELIEDPGDPGEVRSKYDPALIRVDPRTFSLHQIIDMLDAKELDLTPDFQRKKVWKDWQKSRLIESIFLRIPLPAFYFAADGDGLMHVVDGLQRLSTIYDFVKGSADFSTLRGLEYLTEAQLGGMTWASLGGTWKRRLHTTQIFAHVIDPQTPMPVKFQIFRRINQGGEPLTSMEIINSLCRQRSRDFLRGLANSPQFLELTDHKLKDDPRMADRESVLTICALHLQPEIGSIDTYNDLYDFLATAARFLDSPHKCPDNKISHLEDLFYQGISIFISIKKQLKTHHQKTLSFNRSNEVMIYLSANKRLRGFQQQNPEHDTLLRALDKLDPVSAMAILSVAEISKESSAIKNLRYAIKRLQFLFSAKARVSW